MRKYGLLRFTLHAADSPILRGGGGGCGGGECTARGAYDVNYQKEQDKADGGKEFVRTEIENAYHSSVEQPSPQGRSVPNASMGNVPTAA
jgi:hypothetical protein